MKTRVLSRRTAALALLLAAAPEVALGQGLEAGDSLVAAGDTTAAIAAYERAVEADLQNTEAHYRAGRLRMARFVAGSRVSEDRRRAEEHFQYATRFAPDSAKYWMALAETLRTEGNILARVRVPGLVDRAREAAIAHGSADLADIEFRAAEIDWGRYEQLANRHLFIGEALTVDQTVMMDQWQHVEDFFQRQVKPDPGNPGASDRTAAEEHLRAALAANPRHVAAAGLLMVLLGEEDRWAEGYEMARRVVRAAPDSGRAWAVLGVALTRQLRWAEAQAAFDTALQRMTPAELAPFQNLGLILKAVDQARFYEMSPERKAQLTELYWGLSQPLFLSELNEVKVEFFARLAYVIHRWSDPLRGFQGYESDRGLIYVRYGPPDTWASFGRGRVSQIDPTTGAGDPLGSLESERNVMVWLYQGSELRFMFSMTPGFNNVSFAGDFGGYYQEAQGVFPVRFDNVPAVVEMDTMLVQFVQFRGEGAASTELGIYTFMPIGRMARGLTTDNLQLTTAAMVRDGALRDVQRHLREETITGGDPRQVERRSFRFELSPSEYVLRVEARIAEVERAARSTSVLAIRSYGTDSLMLSDVLVADRVAPRDSTFDDWTDFFIIPSAGRFLPESPVGLLWEIYNLQPDPTGIVRYTVDLQFTVREIERHGFAASILGGIADAIGLTAEGDDQVALTYDRDLPGDPSGRQVEYLSVDLENAPEATYGVFITVTDKVSGRSVTARRQFVVSETPLNN